jgi:SAM-dependent methyltransferase
MRSTIVNQTLVDLIFNEPLEKMALLDVGCGSGALSFIAAKRANKVIGIDISVAAIEYARKNSVENTSFFVMDADREDYSKLGNIDAVISNLCMSDEIIRRSFSALPGEGAFIFACFHSYHLIEGGRRSRFSYSEEEMRDVLERTGFTVEYLVVEAIGLPFRVAGEALEILGEKTRARWEKDGRLKNLFNYIDGGGRSLTKSILVGKARK